MSRIELEVGEVVVETDAERASLDAIAPALREAFRLLAERLDRTPFRGFGEARRRALARIDVTGIVFDELLSPRGAERLADELYRRLLRSGA